MSESIGDFLDQQFAAQDAGGASGAPAQEPVTSTPPPAETTPPPAQESTPDPVDLDGDLEGDKFDRAYVERLRKEAAGYRSRAKEFESVFEGYADDERDGLFNLAKMLRDNPKSAAEEMQAAAEAILKQYAEPELGDPDDESSRFLTVADYQKMQEDARVAAETKAIETEARELGYTVNPKDVDYRTLLLTAQNQTKTGSIAEAHQILEARKQAIIDNYLAAKANDAENSPTVPSSSAQIPGSAEPIKSFKDARNALENFIAQQRQGM